MTRDDRAWNDHLESTTRSIPSLRHRLGGAGLPCLTILCHPDLSRVGEQSVLNGVVAGRQEELSRLNPYFSAPEAGTPRPLADPHISRRPVLLSALADGGVGIDPGQSPHVELNGVPARGSMVVDPESLEAGVVLVLRQRIALCLHLTTPWQLRPPRFGLVGESTSILDLRQNIERLAQLDYPVLLRGESGTGKELVARALHDAGPRAAKPCICVNVGSIPSSLAAAELFGAAAGAFTGAGSPRPGHFRQAHGGTLFLDEIGDAPADVQVLLLRALETGRVQSLGSREPVAVDVRLIAATDVDLDVAIEHGEFRSSLFHRLSTCELDLPPLRRRREDIGRLFVHFLRRELATLQTAMPDKTTAEPQVPATLVARLALYSWPGNVRELLNVVRQLLVAGWGRPRLSIPPALERRLNDGAEAVDPPISEAPAAPAYRSPDEIRETELLDALGRHRWNIKRTAEFLSIARGTLYRLMRDCPGIRKASELTRDELIEAAERCESLDAMVDELKVSKRGLQLRLSELGLVFRDGKLEDDS